MSACERCWCDAYKRSMGNGKSQAENYSELIVERESHTCELGKEISRLKAENSLLRKVAEAAKILTPCMKQLIDIGDRLKLPDWQLDDAKEALSEYVSALREYEAGK